MAAYFFDSSAVVKRYVRETGTAWVLSVTAPTAGHFIYVAHITGVEVVSALTRQARHGALAPTAATTALMQFRYDFAHQYHTVDITSALIARAMALAEAHALRGYDAVQCAAALMVHTYRQTLGMPLLTLVSADVALNTAAAAEGLPNLCKAYTTTRSNTKTSWAHSVCTNPPHTFLPKHVEHTRLLVTGRHRNRGAGRGRCGVTMPQLPGIDHEENSHPIPWCCMVPGCPLRLCSPSC